MSSNGQQFLHQQKGRGAFLLMKQLLSNKYWQQPNRNKQKYLTIIKYSKEKNLEGIKLCNIHNEQLFCAQKL